MTRAPRLLSAVALFLVCVCARMPLAAQSDATAEVVAVRARVAQAAKQKDRATLERLLSEDFTHTHAVGRMDDRERRIRSLVSGDATVDSVEPDEMRVRFYGADRSTAIAVGKSTVGEFEYRWTVVYIRSAAGWRMVASHASEIQQ